MSFAVADAYKSWHDLTETEILDFYQNWQISQAVKKGDQTLPGKPMSPEQNDFNTLFKKKEFGFENCLDDDFIVFGFFCPGKRADP